MYDGPGVRVELVASKTIAHGAPCFEDNFVGFAAKVAQLDRFTDPLGAGVANILNGETFVLFVGGVHELPLSGAIAGVAVGARIFLDTTDNSTEVAAGVDRVPLGIVQSIDTSRTPDVAKVNTNAWQSFEVGEV